MYPVHGTIGIFSVPDQITRNSKVGYGHIWTGHHKRNSERISEITDFSLFGRTVFAALQTKFMEDFINMNVRNEIKAQIIRTGMTMQQVVDLLSDEYGWSDSVSNLSAKLQRESIRYKEVVELADVLGYDIVWQKRRDK